MFLPVGKTHCAGYPGCACFCRGSRCGELVVASGTGQTYKALHPAVFIRCRKAFAVSLLCRDYHSALFYWLQIYGNISDDNANGASSFFQIEHGWHGFNWFSQISKQRVAVIRLCDTLLLFACFYCFL